ncbi:MAG TPA: hypothetical protein VKI20_03085 [Acidimicrobiales bacterium]|nr:hypothetical protein [Acidimicrobiales bacterium]
MTRRPGLPAAVALVVLLAAVTTVLLRWAASRAAQPRCQAAEGSTSYLLDLEQAANATTVAAVGKRLGLPDHAVTIAVAAALQESKLRNLSHGDLDSLGIFQQRPSQGWGTASQVMVPRYAATAFYTRLATVPGWQSLGVADAAQAVQHSAAPDAYAGWEAEARLLARVFTGEVPAGLTCRFPRPGRASPSPALQTAAAQELGSPALGVSLAPARGWTVAAWLVGHARQYRITSVAFSGQRWTPGQRTWQPDPRPASPVVQVA